MSNLQTTLNRKVAFLLKPSLHFTNEVSNPTNGYEYRNASTFFYIH